VHNLHVVSDYDDPPVDRQGLLQDRLIGSMVGLSPQERDVLRLRFGLKDQKNRGPEEVAVLFGVTPARVREIQARAFQKLRNPLEHKNECSWAEFGC
jgi:DNA-directed RNA polymerase sigma subunit (sigma70/sigma32)